MNMELAIVLSEGKGHLCYREEDGSLVDLAAPVITFNEGDDFKIVTENNLKGKPLLYHARDMEVVVEMYRGNRWICLSLQEKDDDEPYAVLTVNLEKCPAFGIPDVAFIDTNNHPDALVFLTSNGLATDTGRTRESGWVEYPMVILNLPNLYRLNPEAFTEMVQESFG